MLEDEIPLRKIRGAEKSGAPWSAPALSLRRVKITLEEGSRYISPKDRDGFIADLDARLEKTKKVNQSPETKPASRPVSAYAIGERK
jgi:hypothetical protein